VSFVTNAGDLGYGFGYYKYIVYKYIVPKPTILWGAEVGCGNWLVPKRATAPPL